MKGNYTSTAGGSNPRRQSREEEGEEDETKTAAMTQKTSATNSVYDLQPITADKDNLRPLFEIVLEKKMRGETEPAGPAAGPQMETAPISPPLKETQKRKPDSSSTRMENVAKMEPHKLNTDSEKKRKEKETVDPSLMGAQGPESDQNMQERMRVESSSRMENLAKTETNEQNPDSEKKRTERETNDSSLMGAQDPKSGPSMQERMRVESSSRMENIAETGTHEQGIDPKKQRSEEETLDSSLMKMQGPKSSKNIQILSERITASGEKLFPFYRGLLNYETFCICV